MKTQVGKWGNSLAVRIPGIYTKELDLEEEVELEVTRECEGFSPTCARTWRASCFRFSTRSSER